MLYAIVNKNTETEQRVKMFFSLIRDLVIEELKRALSFLRALRTLLKVWRGSSIDWQNYPHSVVDNCTNNKWNQSHVNVCLAFTHSTPIRRLFKLLFYLFNIKRAINGRFWKLNDFHLWHRDAV